MSDGSIVHEDFSKSSWEQALRDPGVARRWGHDPDDCHDPVERVRGSRSVDEVVEPVAELPSEEPIDWPPAVELFPRMLSLMTGLSRDDCRGILVAPRKWQEPTERKIFYDPKGQGMMF